MFTERHLLRELSPYPPPSISDPAQMIAQGTQHGWYEAGKPVLDFFGGIFLLILTAPLLFLGVLLAKLRSPGPAIYRQVRVGLNGRRFTLYKIRTMTHDCEKTSGVRWSVPGDPRVTSVGRFLRLTHIDELPQLWNVIRGDMSLVGPRPERPEFVSRLEKEIPRYRERLSVQAGLTGLAQVQLPPDTNLVSVEQKLARDRYYARHVSLSLDLRILLATLCYLCGLPAHVTRRLFWLPEGLRDEPLVPILQQEYDELSALCSASVVVQYENERALNARTA